MKHTLIVVIACTCIGGVIGWFGNSYFGHNSCEIENVVRGEDVSEEESLPDKAAYTIHELLLLESANAEPSFKIIIVDGEMKLIDLETGEEYKEPFQYPIGDWGLPWSSKP